MTDQEILQDCLIAHKFMMSMYNQFGLECSNTELRKLFGELHGVASEHNFIIFKEMEKKGFYPVTPAKAQDIQQAITMHTQMGTELKKKIGN